MDPASADLSPLTLGIIAMVLMLGLTVIAQRIVVRTFAPTDPRRAIASRVVVWVATAVLVVILIWLRGPSH
jgi:hypothetical protein